MAQTINILDVPVNLPVNPTVQALSTSSGLPDAAVMPILSPKISDSSPEIMIVIMSAFGNFEKRVVVKLTNYTFK